MGIIMGLGESSTVNLVMISVFPFLNFTYDILAHSFSLHGFRTHAIEKQLFLTQNEKISTQNPIITQQTTHNTQHTTHNSKTQQKMS